VIGEKPMASSMDEARKMVKASEKTGKMYMVSQSRRWNEKHHRVRAAVEAGEIGEVTLLNCDFYIGAHFSGFRAEMPSPLILDMSIHHFDLARFFTAADPLRVYAKEYNPLGSWYRGDAAASCVFEMTNGVIFNYRGSWCTEGCHTDWNGDWRVAGDKGTVLYQQGGEPTGEKVVGGESNKPELGPVEIPQVEMPYFEFHGALRDMLAYLRTGKTPPTECHDNIKSLAMVFAVIESSKKGQPVPVKAL
jgi:predicted dehydrogenase